MIDLDELERLVAPRDQGRGGNVSASLPAPVPKYCCGDRLRPCKQCGADVWKSAGDRARRDWDEEVFDCQNCGNRIYVELPD